MKKEMLINVMQPEECRIAILEDGVLEELYVERTSHESYVGNIYKGRIVNIEPSIQAAFVDFGVGRNGFLHVSDVEPAYYRHLLDSRERDRERGGGRRGNGRGNGPRDRRRSEPAQPPAPAAEEPTPAVATADTPLAGAAVDLTALGAYPTTQAPAGWTEPPVELVISAEEGLASDNPTIESAGGVLSLVTEEPSDQDSPSFTEATDIGTETAADTRAPAKGRSRRRRREDKKDQALPLVEAGEIAPDEPAKPESPTDAMPDPESPPRYMDSAERRTDEEDSPSEPLEPAANISDEDIFFPRGEEPAHAVSEPVEEPVSTLALKTDFEDADTPLAEEMEAEPESFSTTECLDDEAEIEDDVEERFSAFVDEDEEMPRRRRPRDSGRRGGGRRMTGRDGAGRPKPPIQEIFKRGQEVIVQVIKEGLGTKGPTLSTYISIAGRYLVLMPGLNRVGVSRKIADEEQRRWLRDIFHELQPPKGLGFIIRTAGMDKSKKELQRDLAYLSRLWQVVVRRIRKMKAPAEIYQESDMITRTIRDTFSSDIDTIWVDEPNAYEHAKEFLQIVMPRYANRIRLYDHPEPLFHKYGIEDEITRIQQRHVPLPNGGSIVIDQTEALVAIDVNSGNFRADNNAEETAYQMNLLAAKEIARQLRLRDLGGVIVNDFIDMREEKHRRGVERALREAAKRDRARTKILKISAFGIIEMTRQRIRPSLKRSVFQDCPYCHATGQVKTCESMSIEVMRLLQLAAHRTHIRRIEVNVAEEVANYLHNKKRAEISRLEESGNIHVLIHGQAGVAPETLEFACFDNNNNEVKFMTYDDRFRRRRD
ncbi:MAG: Rne/Rng family ribonuclease [Gemmataceae bacterium]